MKVVFHSNASKYRKIWRTRLRMYWRMVGEYGPRGPFYYTAYSRNMLTQITNFFLLMTTRGAFVDSVDQDQTAQNVQSDHSLIYIFILDY